MALKASSPGHVRSWMFVAFVVVRVTMVIADGWDTFSSMVLKWSARVRASMD
jgi:hypothetical protein